MLIPFSPPPGIISDDTSFAAEGRWVDGSNVRFWQGKPQVIGGWGKICPTAFPDVYGTFSYIPGSSSNQLIIMGSDPPPALRVYSIGNGAITDISPVGTFYSSQYSFGQYGDTLIVCGAGAVGGIVQWGGDTATRATFLAGAPAKAQVILVTPERQVLAFGCNEQLSGNINNMCIRGSDIENPNDWAATSANNAFEHILEGGGVVIRAAKLLGSYVAVWTDTGLYLGQFLGDPAQTYRFDRIAQGCGAYGNEAVAVVGSTAYWVSPDRRFWTWTIGAEPTRLPCPIGDDFNLHLSQATNGIHAWHNRLFNEIWWFYPDGRDGFPQVPSRYLAVSLNDGSWFRGQFGRRAGGNIGYGPNPYAIGTDGYIYAHELGTWADGAALNWFLQSADQYLDEGARRMMVRGFVPDFSNQAGSVSLTLTCRDRPQSPAVTKGPYTLAAGAKKKDFRASGKLIAVRLSGGDAAGTSLRLGKPLFDAVPTGER